MNDQLADFEVRLVDELGNIRHQRLSSIVELDHHEVLCRESLDFLDAADRATLGSSYVKTDKVVKQVLVIVKAEGVALYTKYSAFKCVRVLLRLDPVDSKMDFEPPLSTVRTDELDVDGRRNAVWSDPD